jgi:[FeFe] hydrogenase (group B1/B3)
MPVFDTNVQYYKYLTLKSVAKYTQLNQLDRAFFDIPRMIIPGKKPSTRCCVYKERAIIEERVRLAIGDDDSKVIEVIDIACDECPASGYTVSEGCRGCIAHRCLSVCKVGAISFDSHQKAIIDKSKCVNCGLCAKACQYSAIVDKKRPCEIACKVGAISMAETKEAQIDYEKCISCGACVYQCPFGAIVDKSSITKAVRLLQLSKKENNKKAYAIVAPSISSQFQNAKLPQVITGIKKLGFHTVLEAALGADMVAFEEAKEFQDKDFMTSSCCPSFVEYIYKHQTAFIDFVSHSQSPMIRLARYIKQIDDLAVVVFIGPCISKKMEAMKPVYKGIVDCVLTFEELQALFDCDEINLSELEETILDNASYYGRIFARSGGLTDALQEALIESKCDIDVNTVVSSGIEECKINLLRLSRKKPDKTFFEGMACVGGCIGGPCCLTHGPKDLSQVDAYGKLAHEKTIHDSIAIYHMTEK